jgi:cytosine/adenosine deaminase-related metal-dependent hydrolase
MRLRARWVLPISSPPIDDGWVTIEGGSITAVGSGRADGGEAERDLGRVALMPGLVNAHTHLELSYLAGAVAPAARFTDWIRCVMALRRGQPDPGAPTIVEAARSAIQSLRGAGTAAMADVSNTLVTVPLLNEGPIAAAVFFELLRFRAADADAVVEDADRRARDVHPAGHVRVWLAPHAPYSVSPRLFHAIRARLDGNASSRTSVHLAESREEAALLAGTGGAFRDLLQDLGAWDDAWSAPGCGSVQYLDELGFLGPRTLVVHGVQMTTGDLERLARSGAPLVTCPRSNRHVGAGDPPIERFYASGVPIAVGTDSLASAPDLGVFGELATLRALAPGVPASRLLASATAVGARAIGCAAWLGSIEPGKLAALIAIDVPAHVGDVEEYLVSGVASSQVHWPSPFNAATALDEGSWNASGPTAPAV